MTTGMRAAAVLAAATGVLVLLSGCTQPARPDEMTSDPLPAADPGAPPEIGALLVTVYGEDVGGFASHFYPLPRADFEKALLESIAQSSDFAATQEPAAADYAISVGLISLVAPQWSGTVTLETTWAVTTVTERQAIGRKMVRTSTPSPFSKVREATEDAAKANIDAGLEWLAEVLGQNRPGNGK